MTIYVPSKKGKVGSFSHSAFGKTIIEREANNIIGETVFYLVIDI